MTTVLGIWAHPDDEVFVSGGFMADAARRGHRVVCIHMTRGEAGLSFRQPCEPETLARLRESELEAALDRLGVTEQRFFDYPDGGLIQVPADEAITRLHEELMRVDPDVVVTFGADGYTGHPDHKTLSAWVRRALLRKQDPRILLYQASISCEWRDSFVPALNEFDFFWPEHPLASTRPDLALQLDDELLTAKIDALREHASQMESLFEAYGERFMRSVASTEHFDLVPTQALLAGYLGYRNQSAA